MAKRVIILILVVDFLSLVTSVPQIFTTSYGFCQFKFTGKKTIALPDKLWTIDTSDFILHFSLCGSIQEVCKNETSSCLFLKNSNKMIDLGHEFGSASEDTILMSQNGANCTSDQNYTLSISFVCSDSIKPKPRLMAQDAESECNFEVTMMRPDCQPRCTETVQGSELIDLRNFPKNVQVHADSKHFSLSLCGSNKNCPGGVSACEINPDGSTTPLASIESQILVYDQGKNELKARGRFRERGETRIVEVLIKCNWGSELANPVYKKVANQGKRYRFEIESSYGCVKLPYSCQLSSLDNLNYDLRNLYTTHGWAVTGAPHGKIFVNICGPLKQPPNLCSAQHSQVCHVTDNVYVNRGSILSLFEARDDSLRARFESGSTCTENTTRTYSTEVEFKCSKTEKGPQFKHIENCVMFLQWETPHACPLDYYKSQNCYVKDRVSNRNLKNLHSDTDRIYPLSPSTNSKLIYNLCGPIHEPCNGHKNASFCLKTGQKESVLGWDTREVISENGRLFMQFSGENRAEIFVNLVCRYQSSPPDLQVTEDSRKYNLTVFTPLACIAQGVFPECVYHSGNFTYDLSPLVLKNKNYVIPGGQGTEIIFNVCGPIITGSGALCRGTTMFCYRNTTALNIKNQYVSLGGVSGPRLLNNSLILEAPMGEFCREVGYFKSVMRFKCSKTNVLPRFVSKESCVYNFIWETPQACPQIRNCTVGHQPGLTFDLNQIKNKIVRLDIDGISSKYEFDLCKDFYTTISNSNKTNRLRRDYVITNRNSFVILDLYEKCANATPLTKVIFKLECSDKDSHFEQTAFENCVLNMTLKTHAVCLSHHTTTSALQKLETNCTVVNGNTGYEFNLIKLKAEDILQKFQINFDQTSALCSGLFCKNGLGVVPQICPKVAFNYTSQFVTLSYLGVECDDFSGNYEFEVLLKCNRTRTGARISQDAECKSVISYDLPEACSLLKREIVASDPTAAIAGGVSTLLLVLAVIIAVYLCKRRVRTFPYLDIPLYGSKRSVSIYTRDSTE
ncbi:cation-independent mannose-6-phosphate receptor [Tribolium castaneum]|uniref:cation-independent mannose-6-phosphate receptor n=1 Tax=Tribolium castaneum TaxID=7070 RepID=UPI00046C1D3B